MRKILRKDDSRMVVPVVDKRKNAEGTKFHFRHIKYEIFLRQEGSWI